MIKAIAAHIRKDFTIEYRNRYALSVSLSFAAIATLGISLASGGVSLTARTHAIILWIILFFTAMSSLSHVFAREEDRSTAMFLRLHSSPPLVLTAKLAFNCSLFLALQALVAPLYLFFFGVEPKSPGALAAVLASGGFALASTSTTMAAIVSKANARGALFSVISLPVSLPVFWVSITATAGAIERPSHACGGEVLFLLAFSCAIIAVSYLLFEVIWSEQ